MARRWGDGWQLGGSGKVGKIKDTTGRAILFHMQIVFINLQQAIVCWHRC